MSNDSKLIDNFVASFDKFGELSTWGDPIAEKLAVGDLDEDGEQEWRPIRAVTSGSHLEALYQNLPAHYPPLYEQLVLSYRWAKVDLELFRLWPNPAGSTLKGLGEEVYRDPGMHETLILNRCLQFGQGPDADYDAVCFDWGRRLPNGDCPVVQIDHEEILCNRRFKIVEELAPSFRELMQLVVSSASV